MKLQASQPTLTIISFISKNNDRFAAGIHSFHISMPGQDAYLECQGWVSAHVC